MSGGWLDLYGSDCFGWSKGYLCWILFKSCLGDTAKCRAYRRWLVGKIPTTSNDADWLVIEIDDKSSS